MNHRIGIGYDIHQLVTGRPLVLGGVTISFDKGLKGHSDGDALLHAIADAMLGAAALGDIGRLFPDTDPVYKDADSAKLLSHVAKLLREKGWRTINVDANVIAQSPKLSPHVDTMRDRIAGLLDLAPGAVSIKPRTNEGLDAVGEGRAIAVQAIVLLENHPSPL